MHQTSYDRLRGVLRGAVRAAVESGPSGGPIEGRASAALDALLAAHPVDRRGRCGSCRRTWALLGRGRRTCLVYVTARYWLNQPDEVLRSRLASELRLDAPSPSGTGLADPDATDVLPRVADDPRTDPLQTPAVPSPFPTRGFPRAGQPDPDHGGVGDHPERPRPRRVPPEDRLPRLDISLVLTGGTT